VLTAASGPDAGLAVTFQNTSGLRLRLMLSDMDRALTLYMS